MRRSIDARVIGSFAARNSIGSTALAVTRRRPANDQDERLGAGFPPRARHRDFDIRRVVARLLRGIRQVVTRRSMNRHKLLPINRLRNCP